MTQPLRKIPEPRWERRKDARPGELTAAALELFAERGFAATKLDDVAKRAGVSKGTLYLYFDSKDELFKAVVREGIVPIIQGAEEFSHGFAGATADMLRTLIGKWWETMGATRLAAIPKLVFSEAGNFPDLARFYFDEVIEPGLRLGARILQRGIDAGEFRPLDTEYASHVMIAPLVFLCLWRYSFGPLVAAPFDAQRYLDAHLDLVLRALRVDPAGEAP